MDLYILRHAIAAECSATATGGDSQRPLTVDGVEKMRRATRGMRAMELEFDLILSSPYLRAKQTAEILAAAWEDKAELEEDARLYDASFTTLLDRARGLGREHKSVGLVGHNPGLGELATALTGSGAEPEVSRLSAKYPVVGRFMRVTKKIDACARSHHRRRDRNSPAQQTTENRRHAAISPGLWFERLRFARRSLRSH